MISRIGTNDGTLKAQSPIQVFPRRVNHVSRWRSMPLSVITRHGLFTRNSGPVILVIAPDAPCKTYFVSQPVFHHHERKVLYHASVEAVSFQRLVDTRGGV